MGVDRRTVMRLEAGKVPAELHLVAAANRALECGIGTLIESLLNGDELNVEVERQLLLDAAHQRARVQKERLDREVAVRYRAMRAEMKEMETLFGDTDRQLKELEARFKQ
jgi:hypothetical protein